MSKCISWEIRNELKCQDLGKSWNCCCLKVRLCYNLDLMILSSSLSPCATCHFLSVSLVRFCSLLYLCVQGALIGCSPGLHFPHVSAHLLEIMYLALMTSLKSLHAVFLTCFSSAQVCLEDTEQWAATCCLESVRSLKGDWDSHYCCSLNIVVENSL